MTQNYDQYAMRAHIPNMSGWSLPAALRLAFAMSDKTDDEIAAEMGWSRSTANRIFHNQDYWPSLPTLPKLCVVLGNIVIPCWIMDNAASMWGHAQPMDAPALFKALRRMMLEVARLLEEGERALEDGKIVSQEARRILRALADVFQVGGLMIAGLQAVILQGRE